MAPQSERALAQELSNSTSHPPESNSKTVPDPVSGGEEVVRRSPQGIMEQIATLDAESVEVLENIKSLLNGASVMSRKIEVLSREVRLTGVNDQDYVCLTDIARYKNQEASDDLIRNWLRNRNTLEFLGLWEQINNVGFNPVEFDGIRKVAGLNSFTLTPKQWIERTGAIGIQSKAGRYGGTFAHLDIALEFASWISVEFKLYLIKEFQRLKETERQTLGWDIRRNLAKINYRIHTDAIQTHLIPPELGKAQTNFVYASEADVLNMALFGHTAAQWRGANPGKKGNIRDQATSAQLVCLSNLENLNALFISQGLPQPERLTRLNQIAIQQMKLLATDNRLPELPDGKKGK